MKKTILVGENDTNKRLDLFLAENTNDLSRSSINKLITSHKVLINDKKAKPSQKIKVNDSIIIDYSNNNALINENLDVPIIYEDDDCIVLNKPAGILTHSKGAFNPEQTIATFIAPMISDNNSDRAGIVHRLDRATSGLIICAKNKKSLDMLSKQFSERKAKKTYIAIVEGHLSPEEAIIDMPIERNPKKPQTFRVGANGKKATTRYKVMSKYNKNEKLTLFPTTGRTHQLRVHLSNLGHPIIGDVLYKGRAADRLYLHAYELELTLPSNKRMKFTSDEPEELKNFKD